MNGNVIPIESGYLKDVEVKDADFIENLFLEPDVDLYYVRRSDHKDSYAFTQFMVETLREGTGLNDIIYNTQGVPVGMISAELKKDRFGDVKWGIGYAVLKRYRCKGYASSAVNVYVDVLKNFWIDVAYLDISIENLASEAVARKCGFKKLEGVGVYDEKYPEIGSRRLWCKKLHQDERFSCFMRATAAFRAKDYSGAIHFFEESLKKPYMEGSLYTDAQIFSNMGMAYSSMGEYLKAHSFLKKAVDYGLINPSIQKELLWLKNNVGLE